MCERQGLQPLQSDPERAGTWTQVTQQKLAIRCLLWPSSRLVLQPWVSDSWINQGVATAPWWVPPVRKKGPSLAAMGGWEPSRRPRASCSSPSHCHFSLKPFWVDKDLGSSRRQACSSSQPLLWSFEIPNHTLSKRMVGVLTLSALV